MGLLVSLLLLFYFFFSSVQIPLRYVCNMSIVLSTLCTIFSSIKKFTRKNEIKRRKENGWLYEGGHLPRVCTYVRVVVVSKEDYE